MELNQIARLRSALIEMQAEKGIGDTEIRLRALERAVTALLEAVLAEHAD